MVGDGGYGDEYDAIPASELFRDGDGTVGWVVEGLIPRGSIALISAPPGRGKSWLALDLAYAATIGGSWMGQFPVSKSRVLLVETESDDPALGERFKKLAKGRGCHIPADVLVMGREVDLDDDVSFQTLRAEVADQRPQLVIIDPLIPAGRSDENQDAALGRIFRRIGELVVEFGVTLILVHHGRGSRRECGGGSSTPGVSADELAFVDVAFTIERPNGELVLSHLKPRWNWAIERFAFAIEDTADGGVVVRGAADSSQAREETRLEADEKTTKAVRGEAMARDTSDLSRDKEQAGLDDAKNKILSILGREWMKRQDIKREAKARGIAEKKMDAALKALVKEGHAKVQPGRQGRVRWLEYRLAQGPDEGSPDREPPEAEPSGASGHGTERIEPSGGMHERSRDHQGVGEQEPDEPFEQGGAIEADDQDKEVEPGFWEKDGERLSRTSDWKRQKIDHWPTDDEAQAGQGFEQKRDDQVGDEAPVAAGERAVRPARLHPACTPLTQIDSWDGDSAQDWKSAVIAGLRSKLASDYSSDPLTLLKDRVFGEKPMDHPPPANLERIQLLWTFGPVFDSPDQFSQSARAAQAHLTYLVLGHDGDSASIRFITDGNEVISRRFHRVRRPDPRGCTPTRPADPVLCPEDDTCEHCARKRPSQILAPMHVWVHDLRQPNPPDGDSSRFARAWNQISLNGQSVYHGVVQQPRLLLAPEDLARHILEAYGRHGTLRDRDYTLVRSGRRYSLIPADESPLPPGLEEVADILPSLGDVGRRTFEDALALRGPLLVEALQQVPPYASVEHKLERNLSAWLCWFLAQWAHWPCLRLRPGAWIAQGDWPWLLFIVRASSEEREAAVNALMMLLREPANERLRRGIFEQAQPQGFEQMTLPTGRAVAPGERSWRDFTENMTTGEARAAWVLLDQRDVDARAAKEYRLDPVVAQLAAEHRWGRTEQIAASILWLMELWLLQDDSCLVAAPWRSETRILEALKAHKIGEPDARETLELLVAEENIEKREPPEGGEVRVEYRLACRASNGSPDRGEGGRKPGDPSQQGDAKYRCRQPSEGELWWSDADLDKWSEEDLEEWSEEDLEEWSEEDLD